MPVGAAPTELDRDFEVAVTINVTLLTELGRFAPDEESEIVVRYCLPFFERIREDSGRERIHKRAQDRFLLLCRELKVVVTGCVSIKPVLPEFVQPVAAMDAA